jgi:UDP-N-acetylmuramate dehydrogenase
MCRVEVDPKSLPSIQGAILLNEPMSKHTSFKIGGPADIFAVPASLQEVQQLVRWAGEHNLPVFVLGAGTNLLVSDCGIRGMVLQLGKAFSKVSVKGTTLIAGAAARLPRVVRKTLGVCLRGLEGLVGIPGTVGGAVCMNAGTSFGCVKDSLAKVTAVDSLGEVREYLADELQLEYRSSCIPSRKLVVTEAVFQLAEERQEVINDLVSMLVSNRKRTQPVGVGTAGSVFKNPPGDYAGRLLEAVGAKGMQVGGARVSTKHANFIYNTGTATAEDVLTLMKILKQLVLDKFGIELEPEIQIVGEWHDTK